MRLNLTFFYIALLFSLNIFAQTYYQYDYKQGYSFIRKAEKSLHAGDLSKAQKLIIKAKASNYGFCGNAWIESHSKINIIEVQILNSQKNYNKALLVLDSIKDCDFGADCNARDSLKVITLFQKFGKEKVKECFRKITVINNAGNPEFEFDSKYWVFLEELNYKFWFRRDYPNYIDENNIESVKAERDFAMLVKNQAFFKLLQ